MTGIDLGNNTHARAQLRIADIAQRIAKLDRDGLERRRRDRLLRSRRRLNRALLELGLVAGNTDAGAGSVSVVSSEGTDLERSAAFRVYSKEHSEASQFLQSPKFP